MNEYENIYLNKTDHIYDFFKTQMNINIFLYLNQSFMQIKTKTKLSTFVYDPMIKFEQYYLLVFKLFFWNMQTVRNISI